MIFDQPPAALPVAKLRTRDTKLELAASLRGWLATTWRWFKPRTIPMIVAFVGLLAVVGSANWLRDYATRAPERLVVKPALQPAPVKVIVEVGPPEVIITLDQKTIDNLPPIQLTVPE